MGSVPKINLFSWKKLGEYTSLTPKIEGLLSSKKK